MRFDYICKHAIYDKPIKSTFPLLNRFELSAIRHFRNDKGNGAEICPAIVSGMVTGDAPVSYWPILLCPK